MADEQNLKNHAMYDPPFHFFLLPVGLILLILSVIDLIRNPSWMTGIHVLVVVWLIIAIFKTRVYALKVQDRVIRLEERLRLQALAPTEWHAQIYRLSEDQLIALRFAADDEVVELAKQALEHNLGRKQIKERIKSWRPDNWRV